MNIVKTRVQEIDVNNMSKHESLQRSQPKKQDFIRYNCAAQVHQSDCLSDRILQQEFVGSHRNHPIRSDSHEPKISQCRTAIGIQVGFPTIASPYHPQQNNESTMLPSKTQTLPKAVQASTATACHPPILLYATFSSLLKIANKNLFYKTHPIQYVTSSTLSHSFFIHPPNRFSIKDFLMTLNP